MVGASLFSSAGIAETYFEEVGINIVAANELVQERADLYQALYPKSKMITGSILDENVFKTLVKNTPKKLDFLIASPPCQGMSVAGNTDLECLYIPRKKKFTVEAKSTKNKLSSVNAGRLAGYREKIGGAYTIVVTPRYVPAVLQDIRTSPIVIIRANTFSEYLYNCIDNDIREIDY